jgi:L-ribulose-5-phosphate 3-epimerase
MQGRLSPMVNGKIQSFPWDNWKQEVGLAKSIGLSTMEWTLDQDRLYDNPLMTSSGQREIVQMCKEHAFTIPSLTGDCFMQAPFWKTDKIDLCEKLKIDFDAILVSCSNVGIEFVVVPLVDGGSLENIQQENILVEFLLEKESKLNRFGIKIIFESDFHPAELKRLMSRLKSDFFGINYDIGNSASLGFNPCDEFEAIGDRILNVHVKDRVLGGTTVPLGEGDADFEAVFKELAVIRYRGNFILQTARADDNDHSTLLGQYHELVAGWIEKFGL